MNKSPIRKIVSSNVTGRSTTTYKHLGSMHDPLSHGNWSRGAGMYGGKGAKSSLAKKVGERLRTEVGLKPIGTRGKPGQRKGRGSIPKPTLEQATARLGERKIIRKGQWREKRDTLDRQTILRERDEMGQRIARAKQGKNGREYAAKWKYDMYERQAMDMLNPARLIAARKVVRANRAFGRSSDTDEILALGPRGKPTDTPMDTGQRRGSWVRNVIRREWDRDDARESRIMRKEPYYGKREDVEKYIPPETLTRMEYQSTKETSTKEISGIVTANVKRRVKSSSYKALANSMVTQKHLGSLHDPLSHGSWSRGAGMYGGKAAGALAKKVGDRLRDALGAGKVAFGKVTGAARRVARSATSQARTTQLPARRLRREAAREATRAAARTERTTRAARIARTAQTIQGVKDKITQIGATMRGKKVPLVKPSEAKAPQSGSRLDKLRDLTKKVTQGVKDKVAGATGAAKRAAARATQIAKDLPYEIGATMRGKKVPLVKPGEAKAPQSGSRLDKMRDLAKRVGQGVKDKVEGATGAAKRAAARAAQVAKDLPYEIGATMRGKKVPLVKPGEPKPILSQSRLDKMRDLAKRVGQGVKDKVTELGATMRGKKITADANKRIDVSRDTANNGGIPSSAITRGVNRPQTRPGPMGRPQLRPDGMQRPVIRPGKKPLAPDKTPKTIDAPWYKVTPPDNKPTSSNGVGTKKSPSEAIKLALQAALIIGGFALAGGAGAAISGGAGAVADAFGVGLEYLEQPDDDKKKTDGTATKEIRNIVERNIARSLRSSTQ